MAPAATLWCDAMLEPRLHQLGELLRDHAGLWRARAFKQPVLAWERNHTALAGALRALPLIEAEHLAGDDAALAQWLSPFLPAAGQVLALCALATFPADTAPAGPEPRDIPGRKWRQIAEFVQRVPALDAPALEWCAGKAHLSRLFGAAHTQPVTALEWDAGLVAEGNRLARRDGVAVDLHCVDVLAPAAGAFVQAQGQVLALHACGDLHRRLLECCAERKPRALALAPCCYHRTAADTYVPLSAAARATAPALSRDELRTAVQESVTAPARVQRQRRQLQAWRLGFDLLQRELRGVDDYLPTPPLSPTVLRGDFADCCRELAQRKGFTLPAQLDYAAYERAGVRRFAEVSALDLVRVLFRRPLELWLILDRAVFLREHGYSVEVGLFCARGLSPRNVLIRARRPQP